MSSTRILDRLGSAAFTIAVLSLLLLFVPRLVRAETVWIDEGRQAACVQPGVAVVTGRVIVQ